MAATTEGSAIAAAYPCRWNRISSSPIDPELSASSTSSRSTAVWAATGCISTAEVIKRAAARLITMIPLQPSTIAPSPETARCGCGQPASNVAPRKWPGVRSMIAEYDNWDATAMAAVVAAGEVSADELLDEALARTAALNPALNAVVLVQERVARAAIRAGLPAGPLTGVPFLLKDLGCEAVDFPSHNGSRLLADTRYPRDSAIYERIRATGVVTFGRTTSPEGGIGPATESAVYGGPTRNPWNPDHTSGGSSGGAGAAVAAGIVPAAHGSDGGGSVRIPASCCGLFGFKPTRARLPDGPYVGEGWAGMAIDGFLTRTVRDTALLLDACAGPDLGAPYVAPPLAAGHRAAIAGAPPRRLRVAYC